MADQEPSEMTAAAKGTLSAGAGSDASPTEKVVFNYIKSNFFRVIHVDGIIGGPGPRSSISVNFFSERLPIPTRQAFTLNSERTLGDEIQTERRARSGIVREVEAGVVMDLSTAKMFLHWLAERIADVERLEVEHRAMSTQSPTAKVQE